MDYKRQASWVIKSDVCMKPLNFLARKKGDAIKSEREREREREKRAEFLF